MFPSPLRIAMFLLLMSGGLWAQSSITVDVGGYPGRWSVSGLADNFIGNQTVALPAGDFAFELIALDYDFFVVSIDGSGNVTTDDSARGVGGSGTLALVTHPVSISANGYPGRWRHGADDSVQNPLPIGDQLVNLPASDYTFGLHAVDHTWVTYTVDTFGNVTTSNPARLAGGPGTLSIVTHSVDVFANDYPGRWRHGADDSVQNPLPYGDATLTLAAADYVFGLHSVDHAWVTYAVTTSGDVISDDPARLTASFGTLSIVTHPIDIFANDYPGRLRNGADDSVQNPLLQGDHTVALAAADYTLGLHSVDHAWVEYTVSPTGNVTSADPARLTAGFRTLDVVTHPIAVSAHDYPGRIRNGADDAAQNPLLKDDHTVNLAAADYTLGLHSVDHAWVDYTVSTNGTVTSTDPTRLIAGFRSLDLVTHPIDVSAHGYPGRIRNGADDSAQNPLLAGDHVVNLAAADYLLGLHSVDHDWVAYSVDVDGEVTSDDPDRVVAGFRTLDLVTHPVDIFTNGYPGRIRNGADDSAQSVLLSGDHVVNLAAADYTLGLHGVDHDWVGYTVDINGAINSNDPARLEANPLTLEILTHPIEVSSHGYPGRWRNGADDSVQNPLPIGTDIISLAAATYVFGLHGVDHQYFDYTVDSAGFVTTFDTLRGTGGDRALDLVTRAVEFDVDNAPGWWWIGDPVALFTGDETICLPPADYDFKISSHTVPITVGLGAGAVTPAVASVTVADLEYALTFTAMGAVCNGPQFLRGDCDRDGVFGLNDPIHLLLSLFGGAGPTICPDACDSDDSGALELNDVIVSLIGLFGSGAPLPAPNLSCGIDPTVDPLGCDLGGCP